MCYVAVCLDSGSVRRRWGRRRRLRQAGLQRVRAEAQITAAAVARLTTSMSRCYDESWRATVSTQTFSMKNFGTLKKPNQKRMFKSFTIIIINIVIIICIL